MLSELLQNGFCVVPRVISDAKREKLLGKIAAATGANIHGARNLLDFAFIRELAREPEIRALVEPTLGDNCFAVRGLFFDKTPDANWLVPRHQDLTIAVQERHEVEGFGPWSTKDGVPHVQPPREWLDEMLSVRLHWDDCDQSNGALRVVAGSHQQGKLSASEITQWFKVRDETVVPVPPGGAMVFRPLLIHASSPAQSPSHRRVVHLEFASRELPFDLRWKWKV